MHGSMQNRLGLSWNIVAHRNSPFMTCKFYFNTKENPREQHKFPPKATTAAHTCAVLRLALFSWLGQRSTPKHKHAAFSRLDQRFFFQGTSNGVLEIPYNFQILCLWMKKKNKIIYEMFSVSLRCNPLEKKCLLEAQLTICYMFRNNTLLGFFSSYKASTEECQVTASKK